MARKSGPQYSGNAGPGSKAPSSPSGPSRSSPTLSGGGGSTPSSSPSSSTFISTDKSQPYFGKSVYVNNEGKIVEAGAPSVPAQMVSSSLPSGQVSSSSTAKTLASQIGTPGSVTSYNPYTGAVATGGRTIVEGQFSGIEAAKGVREGTYIRPVPQSFVEQLVTEDTHARGAVSNVVKGEGGKFVPVGKTNLSYSQAMSQITKEQVKSGVIENPQYEAKIKSESRTVLPYSDVPRALLTPEQKQERQTAYDKIHAGTVESRKPIERANLARNIKKSLDAGNAVSFEVERRTTESEGTTSVSTGLNVSSSSIMNDSVFDTFWKSAQGEKVSTKLTKEQTQMSIRTDVTPYTYVVPVEKVKEKSFFDNFKKDINGLQLKGMILTAKGFQSLNKIMKLSKATGYAGTDTSEAKKLSSQMFGEYNTFFNQSKNLFSDEIGIVKGYSSSLYEGLIAGPLRFREQDVITKKYNDLINKTESPIQRKKMESEKSRQLAEQKMVGGVTLAGIYGLTKASIIFRVGLGTKMGASGFSEIIGSVNKPSKVERYTGIALGVTNVAFGTSIVKSSFGKRAALEDAEYYLQKQELLNTNFRVKQVSSAQRSETTYVDRQANILGKVSETPLPQVGRKIVYPKVTRVTGKTESVSELANRFAFGRQFVVEDKTGSILGRLKSVGKLVGEVLSTESQEKFDALPKNIKYEWSVSGKTKRVTPYEDVLMENKAPRASVMFRSVGKLVGEVLSTESQEKFDALPKDIMREWSANKFRAPIVKMAEQNGLKGDRYSLLAQITNADRKMLGGLENEYLAGKVVEMQPIRKFFFAQEGMNPRSLTVVDLPKTFLEGKRKPVFFYNEIFGGKTRQKVFYKDKLVSSKLVSTGLPEFGVLASEPLRTNVVTLKPTSNADLLIKNFDEWIVSGKKGSLPSDFLYVKDVITSMVSDNTGRLSGMTVLTDVKKVKSSRLAKDILIETKVTKDTSPNFFEIKDLNRLGMNGITKDVVSEKPGVFVVDFGENVFKFDLLTKNIKEKPSFYELVDYTPLKKRESISTKVSLNKINNKVVKNELSMLTKEELQPRGIFKQNIKMEKVKIGSVDYESKYTLKPESLIKEWLGSENKKVGRVNLEKGESMFRKVWDTLQGKQKEVSIVDKGIVDNLVKGQKSLALKRREAKVRDKVEKKILKNALKSEVIPYYKASDQKVGLSGMQEYVNKQVNVVEVPSGSKFSSDFFKDFQNKANTDLKGALRADLKGTKSVGSVSYAGLASIGVLGARQSNRQFEKQVERMLNPQVKRQVSPQLERQVEVQKSRQFEKQVEKQIERQLERQVEKQVQRQHQTQLQKQSQQQLQKLTGISMNVFKIPIPTVPPKKPLEKINNVEKKKRLKEYLKSKDFDVFTPDFSSRMLGLSAKRSKSELKGLLRREFSGLELFRKGVKV